ncbi:MAG: adenylate/guanylate cyclase domain-containing protein [Candidatus Limnocylindria bacterium]
MGDADLKRSQGVRRLRRLWRTIPSAPRCKMCTRPFGGPGGPVMRLIGLGPWPGNPKYCRGCFKDLYRNREGAEIECTLLFADIRGSTQLGESMPSADFRALMDRFYATAAEILVEHEAIVDKFVGDEVIGIFVPALTDGSHGRQAIDAGLDLLRATGNDTDVPWAPIGIGVNTGRAYVGAVGTAEHVEFTALGDTVNVTARLASLAGAGEILVTDAAAREAGLTTADGTQALERRHLDLRGRTEATDVLVLTLASA